ncbi:hypothetical protein GCM10008107_25710 [Psychrosphaera saromensis]|uniref:Rhombosortase n=1 Tax=Psychrosphaera saromensis TaxID=716813 RepID=A0A2S7UWS1_9GAMM|nr:rhombosortase [Psychrosphaera saromensis]PQJ54219.1 rhombosortase [Psychrosphaera saromensis]GHB74992.1 hypothetical protein GCM10008107_25710 [Psychrosphaera saromensis]GLQ12684.1 hypothetical protein GCM10007917_01390 [Psychrosphaera saromensis]
MLGFPTQKQYLTAPLCFIAILFLLEVTKPVSMQWFGFIPGDILNGEVWRLMTGQMLHTNFNHVLLNVSGVALVWALHGEYYNTKHYVVAICISLILVGIGILLFGGNTNYAGVSGILHTLIVYGAIIDIKKHEKTGWLLLIGITAKVLYELIVGPAQSTKDLIQADVAVEAHLIGCIVGILMGLGYLFFNKAEPNKVDPNKVSLNK